VKQQGFPIPIWILVIDALGMALVVLGVLALFGGMAESLGAFGDPVAAAACLVVGMVLIGGSAVHIVLTLRGRAEAQERGRND